jgi:hypothetical protein
LASKRASRGGGDELERRVATHYEALGFRVRRNVNLGNHQIDIIAEKYVRGGKQMTLMVEVKHRSNQSIGINEVTPFINTAKHLIGDFRISGAVLVTDGEFSQDASGSVFDYPSIGLLHVRDLEKDLFYDSEATLKVCIDYEASTIYREYVPLSGILRASNKKVTDVVSFVGSWANKNNTLLVLIGDFGSGKTTIMERVRYEFSKGRVQGDDNLIPVLLRLRTLRHYPDLWSFISTNLVRNHYMEPPEQTFNSQLSAGRLLILLDGFDEVYTGADARERGFFLAKLSPLLSSPSPCVLSTRPTYFESFNQMVDSFEDGIGKMPTLDRVNISRSSLHQIMDRLNLGSRRRVGKSAFSNVVEVAQLSKASIRSYLSKFKDELEVATHLKLKEIVEFLYQTYDLEDLMRRPLLLEMIVQTIIAGKLDITKTGSDIGPSTLYDMYTQMAVLRDMKKEPKNQFLKAHERLAICRQIAREMLESRSSLLQQTGVLQALERAAIPTVTKSKLSASEVLERAQTDIRVCAFLRFDEGGGVRFAHNSFQEFFVAQHIYIGIQNDPANLQHFARMPLTGEILYFLGSFARDQVKFGRLLISAIRNTSVTWPNINTDDELRDLLHRVAVASGTLLRSLSVVGGEVRDVELRKVKVDSAYFMGVAFYRILIVNVIALKWTAKKVIWTELEVRDCSFEMCDLDLDCGDVQIVDAKFHSGVTLMAGYDWHIFQTSFKVGEATFRGSGRCIDVQFTDCSDVCFGSELKLQDGSDVSFFGSGVRGESFVRWYESDVRLEFENCFFSGLWLDTAHHGSLLACSGIVFSSTTSMSGHSDVAVAERNPELLFVDVETFRRGVMAGEQRALTQEDLARAAIDDATYRRRIAGLASERDFENYVQYCPVKS